MIEPVRCARHPDTETYVTCSKCGVPICPRCMVQTPVGARCPDCAHMRRVPTYDVSPVYVARALGAGILVAAAAGVAWVLIPFVSFFMAIITGYAAGEVISRATNHKRGRVLQAIGGFSVLLAYLFSRMFAAGISVAGASGFGRFTINATMAGLLNPLSILVVVIGIVIAVRRLG